MQQIIKNNKNNPPFPLVFLLTLSTICTLIFSQNFLWQVGMSHDSVFYLNGAKSLLAGKGYPYTHFPPLYSASIAFVAAITGKDVISSATIMIILLYGLNLFLGGLLIWRLKGSLIGGLGIIFVFAVLPGIARLHFEAMSEPLFFSLLLLSYIFLIEYLKDSLLKWAILAGFVAGLSALTRYVGIFLIATVVLAVLIFNKSSIKKRIAYSFISGVTGILPIAAWWISNQVSKGMLTNRLFVFHPKDAEFFHLGWQSFSELVGAQYITKWTLRLPGYIFIISIYIIFALIVYCIIKNLIKGRSDPVSIAFVFICLISLILYVSTLFASVTFFDDSTKLTPRILSPIFIQIILIMWALYWPSKQIQVRVSDRIVLAFIVMLLIFVNLPGYLTVSKEFRKDGILFTGRAWSTSETLSWLNHLPDSIIIYSNENIPLGFFTKHPTYSLPERKSVTSGIPNPSFEKNNAKMINDIRNGKAMLIIFTKNEYSEIYPPKEILIESLEKCHTFEDSEVYTGQAYFQEYCGK